MKNEESKKLRELRAWARKALMDGELTEEELKRFIRSRRPSDRYPVGVKKDEENKPSTDQR